MFAAIKQAIGKESGRHNRACPTGADLQLLGFDGGKTLVDAGAVMGDDLSPQKARILLMLLLQNGVEGQKDHTGSL